LLYYIKMSSQWKHNHGQEEQKKWNGNYNNALEKALTAFYKRLDSKHGQSTVAGLTEIKKIVKNRGAGTGDKDNIHALYEGLKKKYTQDYPSTIAKALKSIANFACIYAADCSNVDSYQQIHQTDALANNISLWAQPIPDAVMIINGVDTPITHELWNQLLGLIYLEFRSTLQKPGDVLYWYGKESVNRQGSFRSSSSTSDVGKDGWFNYILPQGGEVQNITNATYPYGREDIVSTFQIPLQMQQTKISIDTTKYPVQINKVQPLKSWFDGRQGKVEFFRVNDYNELESRFVEWWTSGRSAIYKTLDKIFRNVTNENVNGLRQRLGNCFVGPTLSPTRVTQGSGFTTHPFLLVLYSNWDQQQARAIKSAFQNFVNLAMVRGNVTKWLDYISQLLWNCPGGFSADNTCGNPLLDTGACPCFKKNGTTWDLDPRLKFTVEELRGEGGWWNYFTSFVWNKQVNEIDQKAMCNPGIWMFIDLPSMPHSLIIIIRHGAIFSIGVGVDDSNPHPGSGGFGPGMPGTLGELLIHSPDDSILGNFKINTDKQFKGILSGEFTKKQRIRTMGYYNTTIQNKLQQTLDNATTSGSIAGTKAVTLTMSSKFGTYRTLSNRNFILWFFTGGVNCTSFAEWLSGSRGTMCISDPAQRTQTYTTSVDPNRIHVDHANTVSYDDERGGDDGDYMDEGGGGGSPKRRKYKHKKRRKQKTKRRRKRKTKRKRRGKKRKTKKKTRRRR